jgi:hypothetical protein
MYHRLKPGGVQWCVVVLVVAMKLKYHRLKPGGVLKTKMALESSSAIF